MGYHALKVPRPGSFDMFCQSAVQNNTEEMSHHTPFDWLTLETGVTFPPYEFVWQSSVLSTALPCCPKSCAHTQERLLLCWHANLSEADLQAALTGTTQRLNKAPDSGKVCPITGWVSRWQFKRLMWAWGCPLQVHLRASGTTRKDICGFFRTVGLENRSVVCSTVAERAREKWTAAVLLG